MPQRQRTAAIIGGSLTGLIAARLLAQKGWAAHVFERVPGVLSGRGAGIGTHREFFDVLSAARLPDGPDIGVYVTIRRMFAKDGRVTLEHRYPQVLAHWDSVYSLLLGSIDRDFYHLGKRMTGFAKSQGAVSVQFENGDTFEADLLIGADGIRSSVRSVLFPGCDASVRKLCCVAGNHPGRAILRPPREPRCWIISASAFRLENRWRVILSGA